MTQEPIAWRRYKGARERLGNISQSTFYRWLKEGMLEVVEIGGVRGITDRSIDALIGAGLRETKPEPAPLTRHGRRRGRPRKFPNREFLSSAAVD